MNNTMNENMDTKIKNEISFIKGRTDFIGNNLVDHLTKPECNTNVIILYNLSTEELSNIYLDVNKEVIQKAKQKLNIVSADTNKKEKQKKKTTLNQKILDNTELFRDKVAFIKADARDDALLHNIFKNTIIIFIISNQEYT